MSAEQTVRIDGTVPVSGTVTSTPSGTQNVLVTNTSGNPVIVQTATTASANLYTTLVTEVVGTVAAQNLLSVFNPAASGKTFTFFQFVALPYAGGAATATASVNVFRTTAASAGTLRAAADINKFTTTEPNSVAEVRTGNPTTTNGAVPIISIPPAITSAGAGTGSTATIVPPTGAAFICLPGEGVVVRVAAGDVDQLFDLGFTWSEA